MRIPPLAPLTEILHQLDQMKGVSAPRPENLHFTLKFLGDTDEEKVPAIRDTLDRTARTVEPFKIQLQGTGLFPPRGDPRIFWAGVASGHEALTQLAQRIEKNLAEQGFPNERRPFAPHLTLARIKARRVTEKIQRLQSKHPDTPWGQAPCHTVSLVQSRLQPGGPVYTDLSEHPLGGG